MPVLRRPVEPAGVDRKWPTGRQNDAFGPHPEHVPKILIAIDSVWLLSRDALSAQRLSLSPHA